MQTVTSKSLRDLATQVERERDRSRIVCSQRLKLVMDALHGAARQIERRESPLIVPLCLVLALATGAGLGALLFTTLAP